ncbi:class I SAM-dependent methyltransferase [Sphaerothrix gracilis]|uniref:class I SAM-dependent methyltransferase n=1 Tax=Sphaerothrix gracilis TaxID=3151835 RepID=UPI0031FD4D1A
MKNLIKKLLSLPVVDIMLLPLVYPAAWLLKSIRKVGVQRLPLCRGALMNVGVFPIRDHYFEPQFDNRNPRLDFAQDRNLQGINWNILGQLKMLGSFTFSQELLSLPKTKQETLEFHLNNGAFESGDAEYWYQIIRAIKPNRIFEVGSGNSTLMAVKAINKNHEEDPSYKCNHCCIEPYEMPWLEEAGVSVIRKRVEEVELSFFSQLKENDILFIDSSHIIRPQGDVLFEYLELLPSLNKGVIVHIHDIFSPKNYPKEWLTNEVKFWNEQYLLEAFLSHNANWRIIGALNFLHHNHYEEFKAAAPFLSPEREPGSFYIQKVA